MATPNGPWERGYEAASYGEEKAQNPYVLIDFDDAKQWQWGWTAWHMLENMTVRDTYRE